MEFSMSKLRIKLEKESIIIIERWYINQMNRKAEERIKQEQQVRLKQLQETKIDQNKRKTRGKFDRVQIQQNNLNSQSVQVQDILSKSSHKSGVQDSFADVLIGPDPAKQNSSSILDSQIGIASRSKPQYLGSNNNLTWNSLNNSQNQAIKTRSK